MDTLHRHRQWTPEESIIIYLSTKKRPHFQAKFHFGARSLISSL